MFGLVKAGGAVGIPGLYVTEDPGAVDKVRRGLQEQYLLRS